ncbi:MAG: hypothetical protein AAGA00_14110, partial [Pseudomonadota bacterium]
AATFLATSAVGNGADHSLWIKNGIGGGLGSDFDFSPAGTFEIDAAGVGGLDGTVLSQSAGFGATGFVVDFEYDLSAAGFTPTFKSENGSAPGPDIAYTYLTGGTLTGIGALDGLVLTVEAKPLDGTAAVQYGSAPLTTEGPNNKNQNRGLAHWFSISNVNNGCTTTYCGGDGIADAISNLLGRQGDINLDIALDPNQNIPGVPIPAALPLLMSALGFFGFMGWRRKKALS